jgi:hypothetical protein
MTRTKAWQSDRPLTQPEVPQFFEADEAPSGDRALVGFPSGARINRPDDDHDGRLRGELGVVV